MPHAPRLADLFLTRRELLHRCGMGFGMVGLAGILGPDSLAAAITESEANGKLVEKMESVFLSATDYSLIK